MFEFNVFCVETLIAHYILKIFLRYALILINIQLL